MADSDIELTAVDSPPAKPLKRKRSSQLTSWVTPAFDSFGPATPRASASAFTPLRGVHTPTGGPRPAPDPADLLLDRHQPWRRPDLCVHARKVAEVDAWLAQALAAPGRGPLLLLTGPTGSGKSATVRCLCRQRGAALREWSSPAGVGGEELVRLEAFLFRCDRYGGAEVAQEGAPPGPEQAGPQRAVVLLEDLPAALTAQPELLRDLLRRHAAHGRSPLILALSDSVFRELAPHRLLPRAALDELGATAIRFNPVAPTMMKKALQRVADAERRRGRGRSVGSAAIEQLVLECDGDIRCALNRLQFLMARPGTAARGDADGKDSSLCLFRALGKVLNTKRLNFSEHRQKDENVPALALPPHLHREPLAFNPEEVLDASRLPGPLFAAFLHENAPDFFTDVSELAAADDAFSLADCIGAKWSCARVPGTQLSDLYTGVLAARGLAFSKQHPTRPGFRPLRRPRSLAPPRPPEGATRHLLLDVEPFRRLMRSRGRASAYPSWAGRPGAGGGLLTEHDSAFDEGPGPGPAPAAAAAAEDEAAAWMVVTDPHECDEVTIDDADA